MQKLKQLKSTTSGLYQIPTPSVPEKAAGGPKSIKAAVDLIRHAKNPVILGEY